MKTTACFVPDGIFTRHSEGAFIRLNDGRIAFAYSRFRGNWQDDAPSDIVACCSSDEGETWTAPEPILPASEFGVNNIMSVSLLRMANGDIGMFYCLKRDTGICETRLSRSNDELKTFYRHVLCTPEDRLGYYVLNNDRAVRLAGGRIILPVAYHRGGYTSTGPCFFDGRGVACCLLSDDDGATWREAADVVFPPFTNTVTGLQEPGITEKQNGALWMYCRTDKMFQYESFSVDGGEHWTAAQPSRFTSPASPLKIARDPETADLYAVWNPIPDYNGRNASKYSWARTPLVYAVSHDDGASWSEPVPIETDPDRGFCYPALFFTADRALLTAYCSGGEADGACLARLSITKIALR